MGFPSNFNPPGGGGFGGGSGGNNNFPRGPRPGAPVIGGGGPRPSTGIRPARREFQNQSKDEHRINERIRVPQVRLIDQNGGQVGVVATVQALSMARDANLDLVEISPNSSPPVCKILDYGKFKYEKKKKEQEAKKKQVVVKVKEVQLRPNTDEHDLDYKFKNIRQFLEDGDKAKITIMFRGREVAYVDQGYKMMASLVEKVKDIAIVESPAKLEGKKLMLILAPAPAGGAPKKKPGPGIVKTSENKTPEK